MKNHPHNHPLDVIFDCKPPNIDIPLDWTPTQAEEFVTILSHIEEQVWKLYEDEILSIMNSHPADPQDSDTSYDTFGDDNIPF